MGHEIRVNEVRDTSYLLMTDEMLRPAQSI